MLARSVVVCILAFNASGPGSVPSIAYITGQSLKTLQRSKCGMYDVGQSPDFNSTHQTFRIG